MVEDIKPGEPGIKPGEPGEPGIKPGIKPGELGMKINKRER